MKLQTALSLAALGYVTTGCLLPEEMEGGKINVVRRRQSRPTKNYVPIGKGDRFEGGSKVPRGIGSKPDDFKDESKLSILSVSEIESALKGLEQAYPEKMKLTTADDKTYEGRDIYYGVVGAEQPRVFLTSGVHARERGGPDNIVYLVSDLLWADKQSTGLTYGNKRYDVSQVRQALGVGIAIIPSVNPDGIHHDQTNHTCWRKNRRPFGNGQFGVDINRNFRVFWDYERIFHPSAKVSMASTPSAHNYVGPSPLSEPETRSITNVFERVSSLSWYLDLHSALGKVLYSWGDDYAQFDDPAMSFRNQQYDRQRGLFHDKYKEYMEQDDYDAQKSAAERMANAMNGLANNGARYEADETINLYPALGSTDEAMARYYNHTCGANRIHALTFEFGQRGRSWDCKDIFYPDAREYRDNIVHTNVGLMELLLNAAGNDGQSKEYECENVQGTPGQQQPSSTPSQTTEDDCLKTTPLPRDAIDSCNTKGRQVHRECSGRSPFPGAETCIKEGQAVVNQCRKEAQQALCQQKSEEPEQKLPKPDQQDPKNPRPSLTPQQQECVTKDLKEYKACGDQTCRNGIAQRVRECIQQAKAVSSQPKAPSPRPGPACPPGSSYNAFFGGCAS